MKKGWKIFWIVCISVLGAGIVLCIAGTIMGATLSEVRSAYGTEEYYRHGVLWYHNNWKDYEEDYEEDYDDYDHYDMEDHEDYYDGESHVSASGQEVHNFQGIREIDLELSYMQVVVKEGSGDSVIVDTSDVNEKLKDRLILEQEDGELKIEDQTTHNLWKKISIKDAGTMVIQVPKDRALEDVSLEVGAGQLSIESINAGCLDLNVSAGRAVVKQFEVKDLNVDCGAGEAKLSGTVTRNSEIECGVGRIELALTDGQNDYDYELDCGIGQLKVGNDSYTGLSNKRHIDNGTGKKMEIDCGIGEIEVSFGASL